MCDAKGLPGKGHDIGEQHGTGITGSGVKLGIGLARFGESIVGAEALNMKASQLESQAAEFRTLAEKVMGAGKKKD